MVLIKIKLSIHCMLNSKLKPLSGFQGIKLDKKFSFKYLPYNHIKSSYVIDEEKTENEKNLDKDTYDMFDQLLKKYVAKFHVGEKVVGKVVSMDNKFVYIDLGLKDYALLPRNEVSIKKERAEDLLLTDESYEFLVTRASKREVQLILSLKALEISKAWEQARIQLNSDVTVDVSVVEAIKGGYRVDMGGHTSFLPISQVHPRYLIGELIGKNIPVKLVDVDESKNRCVCSNRKALVEGGNVTSTLANLKVGDVVQGYIQNLTAFGAFVDLDGVIGLLHVSQISNDRVSSIEGVFHIGELIKCMVLAVDKEKGRLSLTTKKLEPSPGDMLRNRELVMEKAEDMALMFRERVAAAEAALRAAEEEKNLEHPPSTSDHY
jgi:small subunit ribosomal protein S1